MHSLISQYVTNTSNVLLHISHKFLFHFLHSSVLNCSGYVPIDIGQGVHFPSSCLQKEKEKKRKKQR